MNDWIPVPEDALDDQRLDGLSDDHHLFWVALLATVSHRGRFDARPPAVARKLGLFDVRAVAARLADIEATGAIHCYRAPFHGGRAWVGEVVNYRAFKGLPENRKYDSKMPDARWPGPETEGAEPASWSALPGSARSAIPSAVQSAVPSALVSTPEHPAEHPEAQEEERRGEKEEKRRDVSYREDRVTHARAREAGRSPSASLAPPNDVASGDGADAPSDDRPDPPRATPKVPSAPPPQHEPPRGVGVPKHPEAHLDAFDRAFGVQREPERPSLTAEDLAKRKPSVPAPTDETDEEREARYEATRRENIAKAKAWIAEHGSPEEKADLAARGWT